MLTRRRRTLAPTGKKSANAPLKTSSGAIRARTLQYALRANLWLRYNRTSSSLRLHVSRALAMRPACVE